MPLPISLFLSSGAVQRRGSAKSWGSLTLTDVMWEPIGPPWTLVSEMAPGVTVDLQLIIFLYTHTSHARLRLRVVSFGHHNHRLPLCEYHHPGGRQAGVCVGHPDSHFRGSLGARWYWWTHILRGPFTYQDYVRGTPLLVHSGSPHLSPTSTFDFGFRRYFHI